MHYFISVEWLREFQRLFQSISFDLQSQIVANRPHVDHLEPGAEFLFDPRD